MSLILWIFVLILVADIIEGMILGQVMTGHLTPMLAIALYIQRTFINPIISALLIASVVRLVL